MILLSNRPAGADIVPKDDPRLDLADIAIRGQPAK
jgi:hypothetical protein